MSDDRRGIDKRRWAVVRIQVFTRDLYRCRKCGGAGRLECDHILPIWKYPDQDMYALEGLQTLCKVCHRAKTRLERGIKDDPERALWQAELRRMVG